MAAGTFAAGWITALIPKPANETAAKAIDLAVRSLLISAVVVYSLRLAGSRKRS